MSTPTDDKIRAILQQFVGWHSTPHHEYERQYGRIDPNVADSHNAHLAELLQRARKVLGVRGRVENPR